MECSNQVRGRLNPLKAHVPIIIDDRERKSIVPKALSEIGSFELSTRRLPVGDYLVDKRFLFERKTLTDFISSIISGRLFDQAQRLMKQDEFYPALVLEGTKKDLQGNKMRWEAIQGAMVSLSLIFGLPVLRTHSPVETASTFWYAALQGRTIASNALLRRGYRPKGKAALQSYLLQGLPGVGPARAEELLKHFDSVRAVMTANKVALCRVDGIGGKTAERIVWALD